MWPLSPPLSVVGMASAFAYCASCTLLMALLVDSPISTRIFLIGNLGLMSSTDIVILHRYWRSSSSCTHVSVNPVVGALSLFLQGLVRSSALFVAHCVVRALLRIVQTSSIIFVVIVSSGPRPVSSRPLLFFRLCRRCCVCVLSGRFGFFDRSRARAVTVLNLCRPCGLILAAVAC